MANAALEGIRIVDFSATLAAPFGTEMLAWLGAEVIKVESKRHFGLLRQTSATRFNITNLSKLSITLDLSQTKGVELAKRLVAISDAVVESFRPGVISRLGLDYETLRGIKPDIIMLSLSGFGQTGPEGSYRSYASIFGAMGGLAHLTGYPDGIPTEERGPNDTRGGQFAAFALLAALCYRRRAGLGQYLDLSVREGITCHIGDVLLDYAMNGRDQGRKGNRDDAMAPHNCYRCRGEDKWLSIAVATDEEWRALCLAMGKQELLEDDRFSDACGRWQNQDELDRIIAEWTINQSHYGAMAVLQGAGVAAMPSLNAEEVYTNRHLKARGFVLEVEHPDLGRQLVTGPPWRLSTTPSNIKPSPTMGQHNSYVFGELLGMTPEEIAQLEREQVIY